LPAGLPSPFHTGDLAGGCGISRWFAQRIAYCLRKMNLAEEAGKAGNARLYQLPQRALRRAA
jgi:predicted HTH transcriptional regulator